MRPNSNRRLYRRRSHTAHDGNFFKKETNEQSFFGEQTHKPFFNSSPLNVQRKCDNCEEEDKKKNQQEPKKKEEEKDVKLQKKEAGSAPISRSAAVHGPSLNSTGSSLPRQAQQFFSARMGYDFSGVQIHTGNEAAQSAKNINAKAYTIGNNIVFNEGQYSTETNEGKKLLAHELVHVMQQDENIISRKEEAEPECNETLDLEGLTDAVYNKGAGTAIGEKKKAAKDCDDCDDDCKQISGTLKVPYNVDTTVTLPAVPDDLRPCQQQRVSSAIKTKLAPHEQQHVAAFKTFNGNAMLPINYKGCEAGYNSYLEGLAETEYERRKNIADAKSSKLDPFVVDVDLCCKDKPSGKK